MAENDETKQEEQSEIQPGQGVLIHLGRLQSGEWAGRIGRADDEEAISFTSAFPWEVLRGLAKQVKQSDGQLVAYRMVGEQEMGLCPHASADGAACVMLACPVEEVEARIAALRAVHEHLGDDFAAALGGEIVRLHGTLKEPVLKGKGEDEDILTTTFEITGEDLTPEFRYLKPSAKQQVVAIVYHAYAAPAKPRVHPDQRTMDLSGDNSEETPEVASCGQLVRFVLPDRQDEISEAVCGLVLQNDHQATAVVTIGDEQFVVTELAAEDPLSWTAWRAVPMDEFDGQYHDHFLTEENGDFDHHRITVGEEGAAFVLVGPPVRILLETEEETGASEDGDQQVDEERVNREHKEQARV